ncbi:MAG TPA: F0F1 ATP synthase subunit delta [Terriglobales bacterium]|nr:F0F1 ATP synthase subunit delta [Terriglobales bacterium]
MKSRRQLERDARQLFRFCLVGGNLDEGRARAVTQQLIQTNKRGYLFLLNRFLHLLKYEYARHTAEIESAVPMPVDLRARVLDRLTKAYGPAVTTTFVHNPELIGGMRIKIGNDVYDGTVRSTLACLARNLGITANELGGTASW